MPTASAALHARLSTVAGLMALVADRIYPGLVPENQTLPLVAFVRIDEDEEQAMGGDTDIQETAFEVTSFGADYDSTEAVHEAVRNALRRFTGTSGGVEVADILLRGGQGPLGFDDPVRYEATQTIALRYRRV